MTEVHNLKAKGAAFSLPNLTRVDPDSTGGVGVALCSCGWYSTPLDSGRKRKAAHLEHRAQRDLIQDADFPPEPSEFVEQVVEQLEGSGHSTVVDGQVEPTVTETRSWHGNYSIVMAPFVRDLAEGFSSDLSVKQKNVTAMLRHTYVTGPRLTVTNFLEVLDVHAERVLVELKVWQKAHALERRDLTDMQRYLQNREFIAQYGERVASNLKRLGR